MNYQMIEYEVRCYIDKAKDIFSYKLEDFHLENYKHHPAIKAPVAV